MAGTYLAKEPIRSSLHSAAWVMMTGFAKPECRCCLGLADFDPVEPAGAAGRGGIREGQQTAAGNPAIRQGGCDRRPAIRAEVLGIDQAVLKTKKRVPDREGRHPVCRVNRQ